MPEGNGGGGFSYSTLAARARIIADREDFNLFIISIIILAGLLVGVQTYDGMEVDPIVVAMDNIVLGIFTFECVLKIVAEGNKPWRYLTGKDWAWNNFDFTIVMLCMPFIPFEGGSVKLLRLLRLMRVVKLIKKIPQLQMIVMGLIGGFKSIGYIMLLLFLVFYLYAIVGLYAFKGNDPWHFGNLPIAMNTLFRMSTLEDWTDVMYTNIYGCASFASIYNVYNLNGTEHGLPDSDIALLKLYDYDGIGENFGIQICKFNGDPPLSISDFEIARDPESPEGFRVLKKEWLGIDKPKPIITTLYSVTFIVISALVMLSLFVGAVTMSMTESMDEMKEQGIIKKKERATHNTEKKLSEVTQRGAPEKLSLKEKNRREKMKCILSKAMLGTEVEYVAAKDPRLQRSAWRRNYHACAVQMKRLADWDPFSQFITSVIILAGLLVGITTDPTIKTKGATFLNVMDVFILTVFTIEVVVKVVAQGFEPWRYFVNAQGAMEGWNCFDFAIVVGSLLGAANIISVGSLLLILRLLRLLRVLKLVKSLPQLQVIVVALVKGLKSIGYIAVILTLFFYMIAIVSMMFFKDNDPWHFGTLHISFITLFRLATLEDWTDVMYINMWGCTKYGYDFDPDAYKQGIRNPMGCEPDLASEQPIISAMFFFFFIVVGALVLLTLFIGVVTTSMEEAQNEMAEESKAQAKVADYIEKERNFGRPITDETVEMYRVVFDMLDDDSGGSVEEVELKLGLEVIGFSKTDEEIKEMLEKVDEDGSGEIDFAEFIEFMTNAIAANAAKSKAGGGTAAKEAKEAKAPKGTSGKVIPTND
jgi:voltage-gated sodium channel